MSLVTWVKKSELYDMPDQWTGFVHHNRAVYYRDRYASYRRYRKIYDYHTYARVRKRFSRGYINITVSIRQDNPSDPSRPRGNRTIHEDDVVVSITTSGTPIFFPTMVEEMNMVIAEAMDKFTRSTRLNKIEYLRWN